MTTSSSPSSPIPYYANTTLMSRDVSSGTRSKASAASDQQQAIFVNVFLPPGTSSSSSSSSEQESPLPYYYYQSTRFEGGSMIGPILAASDVAAGGGKNSRYVEPWKIHRNCWRFPYNRECFVDADGEEKWSRVGYARDGDVDVGDGDNRDGDGVGDGGRRGRHRRLMSNDHDEAQVLGVGEDAKNHGSDISFEAVVNGNDEDEEDVATAATADDNDSIITPILDGGHNHHGGHHPPNLHQRGYPPNYNFLPPGVRQQYEQRDDAGKRQLSESHVLYGTDMWRAVPSHDPNWPESGVGLASEFGYGDDGAHCIPTAATSTSTEDEEKTLCGWVKTTSTSSSKDDDDDDKDERPPPAKIVNGVLGYEEAKIGEPFLKIGVGKLIKGSCADCHPDDDDYDGVGGYKFNSPYRFAEPPVWNVLKNRPYHLVMTHKVTLGGSSNSSSNSKHKPTYGYKLKKSMRVNGRVLTVASTLTNLGRHSFATPWYSHHFFTCDSIGIGPAGAYGVDLELHPRVDPDSGTVQYDDSSWASPLADYAEIRPIKHKDERSDSWFDFFSPGWWKKKETRKTTQITMIREVEDGTKIKAEFPSDNGRSKGTFVIHGCGTSVAESIPEFNEKLRPAGQAQGSVMSMYAFNLYIEKGTLSPEPLFLIELNAGASITWTQRIEIGIDDATALTMSSPLLSSATARASLVTSEGTWTPSGADNTLAPVLFVALLAMAIFSSRISRKSKRRSGYESISPS